MPTLPATPPAPSLLATPAIDSLLHAERIAASIHEVLAAVPGTRRVLERRRESRYPYPYPLHLTPLDADGLPDAELTFVVIGKHLSDRGLDFYCKNPLPHRRVVASLDGGAAGWIGLLLELAWCRFGRHGLYDNGGRFLALVRSPLLDLGRAA